MIIVLFCNYKADTEIYTYGHTLALHDALPITDSDAARTGRPGNVGVIGIAVFRERHVARIWTPPHPKPPPYPYPADAQAQAQARDASGAARSAMAAEAPAVAAAPARSEARRVG